MLSHRIVAQLMADEGLSLTLYKDTVGKLTIGYGRNIEDRGISRAEALIMLTNDVETALADAVKAVPNFSALSDNKKLVITCMIFNLGLPKFLTFKKMIAAILANDDTEVVKQMLESKWANDVGDRAKRLAKLWRA